MIRNFLKTTFRNLLKNKSYLIINVLGLGLSLSCCIVGYLNYQFASEYDGNHLNGERIYRIQVTKEVQAETIPFGISPIPLAKAIKSKYSGISHSSVLNYTGVVLKKDLKIFNHNLAFVEEDFLEMFTYPLKYGAKEGLNDPGNVYLSERTASSFFGDIDPTGKILQLINDSGEEFPVFVGGVFEKVPMNTSIKFGAMTTFENYEKFTGSDPTSWGLFGAATFIMADSDEKPSHLEEALNEEFIGVQNLARDDWKVSSYYLENFMDMAENGRELRSHWLWQAPPPPAVIVPLIMGILMLLIACFNFTNTSIAISSKRLKEIGIRKVMGSNRSQLIIQFMGENLMVSIVAMFLALLVSMFFVPAYSAMWEFIDIKLDLLGNPSIYLFLFGLLVFTSVVAGAYPSLYISAYEPVAILRGNLSLGNTSIFSKSLLTAQYTLTVIALITSLAFANNAEYQNSMEVGYKKDGIIAVQVDNRSQYDRFLNRASALPSVAEVAGTSEHIGRWTYGRVLRNGESEIETDMMDFGLDYQNIMDLNIREGRYFTGELYEHDLENSIVVNEALVEEFGWEKPVGQVVQVDDSTRLTVIGVMENFYMYGFWSPVQSLGIRPADDDEMNFVVVKSAGGELKETYEDLESAWYEVAPNNPFSGRYADEELKEAELVNSNITTMFVIIGILALILSCIGLYTLVSLNIIKRVKEIGVRKVLGASIYQIVSLLNRQFLWLLIIAALGGSALSYLAIDALMASIFTYYKVLGVATVLIPLATLFIIALGTASGKILTAAIRNPVESLRYE